MTTRKRASVPAHISQLVRNLRAAGGEIHRDGGDLLINGPPTAAAFIAALRANVTELAAYVVPRVTPEEAATVRMLLSDAGVRIAYITEPAAARLAVTTICADRPDVVGLDFETEALPAFRRAIPVAFTARDPCRPTTAGWGCGRGH